VLRIDFLSQVARQYGVDFIPTMLVFDSEGTLILRQQGLVDADHIRDQILAEDVP
jgi:hypothetical protein